MDCYLTRVVAHLRRIDVLRASNTGMGNQISHDGSNQDPRKRRARAPCCASASSRYPKADKDFL